MSKGKCKTNYVVPRGRNYSERQADRISSLMAIAMDEGTQRTFDLLTCVLHDPDVMGSDTFGFTRIEKIRRALIERDHYYSDAFGDGPEADVKQEELDKELRAVYGDKLVPFRERHPAIKIPGYDKAIKGWK